MGALDVIFRLEKCAANMAGIKSRWIAMPFGRLHYFEAVGKGDGPPILVQHGIGAHAGQFVPLLRKLRRFSRRVIAADLPGHGLSDPIRGEMNAKAIFGSVAPLFRELLVEPTILVGNSMGGAAVLRYSINHPENVMGLVLAAPGGSPMNAQRLDQLMDTFRIDTVKAGREFIGRLVFHAPWWVKNSAWGWVIKKVFNAPVMRGFVNSITPADLFTPEELQRLEKIPTLLLWGERDQILPEETRDFFRAHLPMPTRFTEMPRCGHSPHFDIPNQLVQIIREFATELQNTPSAESAPAVSAPTDGVA